MQLSSEGEVNSGGYILRSKALTKRRAIFLSVRKTVNIQGYSELLEQIKMREYCYPLIS